MRMPRLIDVRYPNPVDLDLTLLRDALADAAPKPRRRWPLAVALAVAAGLAVAGTAHLWW